MKKLSFHFFKYNEKKKKKKKTENGQWGKKAQYFHIRRVFLCFFIKKKISFVFTKNYNIVLSIF